MIGSLESRRSREGDVRQSSPQASGPAARPSQAYRPQAPSTVEIVVGLLILLTGAIALTAALWFVLVAFLLAFSA